VENLISKNKAMVKNEETYKKSLIWSFLLSGGECFIHRSLLAEYYCIIPSGSS
jgi:hypothetical protein